MPDAPPKGSESPMSMHEPNLAVLASKAALVLDRRSHGIDLPLDSVFRVASILRNQVKAPGSSNAVKLLDPLTTDLFSRAFVGGETRSLSQLSEKAVEVIEALSKVGPETPVDELTALRDFCVALSRSALARSVAASHGSPPHPFRR